jgi:site-specific DNA-methyltransferase (adenine-specific)
MILQGSCLERLREMEENSVDSIVTDPPYELGFMGKAWDSTGIAYSVSMWRECLRVLKPGGHLLSFGGSRTYHRMACAIEDAGFEIRDQIMWLYGSGFPKSMDVSKAIDKAAGAEREVVGVAAGMGKQNPEWNGTAQGRAENSFKPEYSLTAPSTDAAKQWSGWGTALKPAHEPICVARKPLEGTVAANVQQHGTGALNIDGCRVELAGEAPPSGSGKNDAWRKTEGRIDKFQSENIYTPQNGRWPANVILSYPEDEYELRSDVSESDSGRKEFYRFFYCAKTSKSEREAGCEDLALVPLAYGNQAQAEVKRGNLEHSGKSGINTVKMRRNNHPTVKPLALMRYLCRLVTPPGGVVLDPFTGSGSTGVAAMREGFGFIGIELKPEYASIANARLLAEVLS